MRISDYFFNYRITSCGIRVGYCEIEGVVGSTINPAFQVSLFFVKERLAVGDEVLQVSQLRAVNRREVRFSNDAPENCEPDSAPTRIGGSNTLFIAMCPAGFETG